MCGLECYAFQKHHWSATAMAEGLTALTADVPDFNSTAHMPCVPYETNQLQNKYWLG